MCVVAVHAMHVDSPLGYPSWSGTSTQHTVSTSGLRVASWNQRTSGIPLVVAYIVSFEHTPLYLKKDWITHEVLQHYVFFIYRILEMYSF